MAIRLGWKLLVCLVFIYLVRSLYCFQVFSSVFRVLKRNNRTKQCPRSIVNEAKYVGYRVPDGTGKFEGLQRSWLYNQTIESGYSYAIRESYFINFKEPFIDFRSLRKHFIIPGKIVHGSRLEVLFSIPDFGNGKKTRTFSLVLTVKYYQVMWLRFYFGNDTILVSEDEDSRVQIKMPPGLQIKMPPAFFTRDIVKLTMIFQTKSPKLMINGKDICTLPLHLYSLSHDYSGFQFQYNTTPDTDDNPISVHGIRITFA